MDEKVKSGFYEANRGGADDDRRRRAKQNELVNL
jgi:hypothetical protein